MDAKIKNRFCSGIEPSTLCAENFFAPLVKKIIYLESGQLTYTENNNFLKFPRREYIVRIPGLKLIPKIANFKRDYLENDNDSEFTVKTENLEIHKKGRKEDKGD